VVVGYTFALMDILPEQKHETLYKVSKVIMPRYLRIRRECDIPKDLAQLIGLFSKLIGVNL